MPRGQLILIEGLDRSGKSTQADLLTKKISASNPAKLLKFPDRSTPIGQLINKYLTEPDFELDDHLAHLLFSANRWELKNEIIARLNQGQFIVLDRYIYSGIAYSLAKSVPGGAKELGDIDWLYSPDKGLPRPDLTLFLSLSIEELSARKGWGEERYELKEFQAAVKTSFLNVLEPHRDARVKVVDVEGKNIQEVQKIIWEEVQSREVDKLTSEEIGRLI